MGFLGAVILPHGCMIFDGDENSQSKSCRERNAFLRTKYKTVADDCQALYEGCSRISEFVEELSPEIIILHTPHGISSTEFLTVYMNTEGKGNALWNGEYGDIEVTAEIDAELSKTLLDHFQKEGIGSTGIVAHSKMEIPLRWGEVVPLWFLKKVKKDCKFIIMSRQFTREPFYEKSVAIGDSLSRFIKTRSERILVAISGDLSHRYPNPCTEPLYLPYIKSRDKLTLHAEAAEGFELMIRSWVLSVSYPSTDKPHVEEENEGLWDSAHSIKALEAAVKLQDDALSCGIGGFVILHRILSDASDCSGQIHSKLLVCRAPSYYGMMAATFLPGGKKK